MNVRVLIGDVRAVLATLPDDHFDCVVTSPPYWGLRDYGTARWEGGDPACDHSAGARQSAKSTLKGNGHGGGKPLSPALQSLTTPYKDICGRCGAKRVDEQIGLEPTLGEHLEVMVAVFREVRRVLKPSGVMFLNYGDCYATAPDGRSAAETKAAGKDDRTFRDKPFSTIGEIWPAEGRRNGGDVQPHDRRGGVLKAKDLAMVPNRLAIALQEDGWWVRSEIIWAKPNPMPESVTDRPATAHEKIFLLSKAPRYHYDAEAVRQGRTSDEDANTFRGGSYVAGEPGSRQVKGNKRVAPYPTPAGWDTSSGDGGHGKIHRTGRRAKQNEIAAAAAAAGGSSGRRMAGFNERWDATEARRKADSVARKHKASGGEHGQKPQFRDDREEVSYLRGAGRNLRNYEPAPVQVWEMATAAFADAHFATFPPELVQRCLLAGCPKGGRVLDPFGGAGTTGLVAAKMGLDCTLIELNPEYARLTRRRLRAGLVAVDGAADENAGGLPLFDGAAA